MTATDPRVIDGITRLNGILEKIVNELQDINVHLENISDGIDSLQKEEN